ncbi:MAG TPA: hypothetical protein VFQ68_39100 [Streptosporangiaceae bacterium]|nr:hypothetical protein [Streptosporangiaceae bacterium]
MQPQPVDPVADTISALAAVGAADRWVMTMPLFLLACFGAEVITGLGHAGLVERVLGLAQAAWPLTVVLSCRHSSRSPVGHASSGQAPSGA